MKKSELRRMIKEEIKSTIKEMTMIQVPIWVKKAKRNSPSPEDSIKVIEWLLALDPDDVVNYDVIDPNTGEIYLAKGESKRTAKDLNKYDKYDIALKKAMAVFKK